MRGLVAIIITSLNRPTLLRETLHAAHRQKEVRTSTVVIDQSDVRFPSAAEANYYLHLPMMRGTANGRNMGLMVAWFCAPEFICFWDDDDTMYDNYCSVLVGALKEHPLCGIASCNLLHMDGVLYGEHHMNTHNRMIRASCLNGDFWRIARRRQTGEDHDWWFRLTDRSQRSIEQVHTNDILYETGNAQEGGLRDPSGST